RVYIPLDALADKGLGVEAFKEARASPALIDCLQSLTASTAVLLSQGRPLPALVGDSRLAMEITVIQSLAERLLAILQARDPLSEPVHLSRSAALATAASGALRGWVCRLL